MHASRKCLLFLWRCITEVLPQNSADDNLGGFEWLMYGGSYYRREKFMFQNLPGSYKLKGRFLSAILQCANDNIGASTSNTTARTLQKLKFFTYYK